MKTVKTAKSVKTATSATAKAAVKSPVATAPRKKSVTVAPAEVPATPTVPAREITNDLIAARAYILWEQQGRPQGNDLQNWLLAESQLKQEIQSFTA